MGFTAPKLSPFDNCNDTVHDLKVSTNYMSPPDKQFILVDNSFQEKKTNKIWSYVPFIQGVGQNL